MDLEHDGDIERRSGVTLWRQIADRIRSGIAGEPDGREGRLPPEAELAERFGVNRHTVRAAIAALVQEGVLRSEQGRGTFIVRRNRLTYPIGTRTRFASGLEGQAEARRSRLLRSRVETPPPEAAKALGLNSNARTIRLETLSEADGTPVSVATHWFDASRLADIAEAFQKTGSITLALRECGVDDYLRRTTAIEARHAGAGDLEALKLSPGAIVLVTRATNTDMDGAPIQYSETRFAADRVTLSVE